MKRICAKCGRRATRALATMPTALLCGDRCDRCDWGNDAWERFSQKKPRAERRYWRRAGRRLARALSTLEPA